MQESKSYWSEYLKDRNVMQIELAARQNRGEIDEDVTAKWLEKYSEGFGKIINAKLQIIQNFGMR
jgi:hypothetical protein